MPVTLIADSGATKCEWCVLYNGRRKKILTKGISLYFLTAEQTEALIKKDLLAKIKNILVDEIYFYGTGLGNAKNVSVMRSVLRKIFPGASIECHTDLLGVARALCGSKKGMACILGTGSNSCYYNGKRIVKSIPSLGYVLGDQGSGAYLGKKVLQHFLYNEFDDKLTQDFILNFNTNLATILEYVYTKPQPNKYLAGFTIFLAKNRGHSIIDQITEDGLNDFFVTHLHTYKESWLHPVSFAGSVAFGFRDIIKKLCSKYEMQLGTILKQPMEGLIKYHS